VEYFTKRYQKQGNLIFDVYDRIVFVVNQSDCHWVLAEINTEDKDKFKFIMYDSLKGNGNSYNSQGNSSGQSNAKIKIQIRSEYMGVKILENLRQWSREEVIEKCGKVEGKGYLERIDRGEVLVESVSQQGNFYDCGVFVCGFLEDICGQREIKFSQKDARRKREELREVLEGERE